MSDTNKPKEFKSLIFFALKFKIKLIVLVGMRIKIIWIFSGEVLFKKLIEQFSNIPLL